MSFIARDPVTQALSFVDETDSPFTLIEVIDATLHQVRVVEDVQYW